MTLSPCASPGFVTPRQDKPILRVPAQGHWSVSEAALKAARLRTSDAPGDDAGAMRSVISPLSSPSAFSIWSQSFRQTPSELFPTFQLLAHGNRPEVTTSFAATASSPISRLASADLGNLVSNHSKNSRAGCNGSGSHPRPSAGRQAQRGLAGSHDNRRAQWRLDDKANLVSRAARRRDRCLCALPLRDVFPLFEYINSALPRPRCVAMEQRRAMRMRAWTKRNNGKVHSMARWQIQQRMRREKIQSRHGQ